MQRLIIYLVLFLSTITLPQSKQQFAELGDFKLTSGEILYNCTLGFRTIGELNSDSSNVVIYPTWFGGTSEALYSLVAKNGFIDTSKYFVIAIDALANGISTSPSNSELQKRNDFPDITIDDMVNSQYKMLRGTFGFEHIYAIVGGSMGGMQALQWIVSYPNFIDKAVAYVSSPRRSTYDRLLMEFREEMIETYQKIGADESIINKMINYTNQLFSRSPEYFIENVSHENFQEFIEKKIENRDQSKTFTVDNHLVQLKAMMKHNIYKDYNNSVEETAYHIKTKLLLIMNKTDMLVHPSASLELANSFDCEVYMLDNNCGHLGVGCEISKCSKIIDNFLVNSN